MDSKKIILLHWTGRFGNRMFLYAFGCQYAKKYNCTFYIPSTWEGTSIFVNNEYVKIIPDDELRLRINQSDPRMDNIEYRKQSLIDYNARTKDNVEFVTTNRQMLGKTNIAFDDLHCMYFPDLFNIIEKTFIREIYEFNDAVKNSELYKELETLKGTYSSVHWRRGDIAMLTYKGAHSLISLSSIQNAILKWSPASDRKKMIWVSDDPIYRTKSYENIDIQRWINKSKGKQKWTYPTGEHIIPEIFFDWLPEFLILHFSKRLFRGNSSFSWWASILGDMETYCPKIESKPKGMRNEYHQLEAEYLPGNNEHFMGSKEEGFHDIIFLS